MKKGKGFFLFSLGALVTFLFASIATAGPGKVEVQTAGDITIRMGAQVRIIPTAEIDRDFGLSGQLNHAEEVKAAKKMPFNFGPSTRTHFNESGGAIKDSHIRGENRLFFNFAHGSDWDVYMALESDTVLDRRAADRTDFIRGHQSQQFGIERLLATFKVPGMNARIKAGWDAQGVDIPFGGLVYGQDDPGIGIMGTASGVKYEVTYIKSDEDEAGYGLAPTVNPIGYPSTGKDEDRTFFYAKAGYNFSGTYLEAFYLLDKNNLRGGEIDNNFVGLQGRCSHGIFKPSFEIAYSFGEDDKNDADISAFALFADLAIDLHEMVGMKKFEAHIGGYYIEGDDDPGDGDYDGFMPAGALHRFTPSFGSEQSFSFDVNPVFGQPLYSMQPIGYGKFENPGLIMFGGGLKFATGRWAYKGNVMAMWFAENTPVETYYSNLGVSDVEIDDFMGIEWNNELSYKLYKSVTLKSGVSFLFPGAGGKDITRALTAYAKGISFKDADESDDIATRLALELLWFF